MIPPNPKQLQFYPRTHPLPFAFLPSRSPGRIPLDAKQLAYLSHNSSCIFSPPRTFSCLSTCFLSSVKLHWSERKMESGSRICQKCLVPEYSAMGTTIRRQQILAQTSNHPRSLVKRKARKRRETDEER